VPEVSLLPYDDSTKLFLTRSDATGDHPVLVEFATRKDLRGLPLIHDEDCQLSPVAASHLNQSSRSLRSIFNAISADWNNAALGRASAISRLGATIAESDSSLMLQMLQCEHKQFRAFLNEQLSLFSGPMAAKALAHRCVFELDPILRRDAVARLKTRMSAEARQFLLDALRHPFPPFVDHAAAALAEACDSESVPALVALLDAHDPAAPRVNSAGDSVVAEIVKINHARNCQLCHAPSWDRSDRARVKVPDTQAPLPPSFSVAYYEETGNGPFVRADVTYLRQDFSLTLPVPSSGSWPKTQRYDFFARSRPAFAWELVQRGAGIDYPQRYAVLRALRKITERDFGNTSNAWRIGLSKEGRFKL
jgi:hypothetical protein